VGDRITYVGLDVHKEGIVVAVAEGGIRGEVRAYGRIGNTAGALDRLMRKARIPFAPDWHGSCWSTAPPPHNARCRVRSAARIILRSR
jgi:hypothetical protein